MYNCIDKLNTLCYHFNMKITSKHHSIEEIRQLYQKYNDDYVNNEKKYESLLKRLYNLHYRLSTVSTKEEYDKLLCVVKKVEKSLRIAGDRQEYAYKKLATFANQNFRSILPNKGDEVNQ